MFFLSKIKLRYNLVTLNDPDLRINVVLVGIVIETVNFFHLKKVLNL